MERDPNQLPLVLEDEGEVVGYLQLTFIPGLSLKGMLRGQIESVRIASSRRGQRLGHVLLQWAIGECRRRGCGMVQLAMNKSREDTLRFYKSLGFVASHDGFKLSL
jgi:GNAT superfamily N-acetyltransferase